jgi:hypothetical protein
VKLTSTYETVIANRFGVYGGKNTQELGAVSQFLRSPDCSHAQRNISFSLFAYEV